MDGRSGTAVGQAEVSARGVSAQEVSAQEVSAQEVSARQVRTGTRSRAGMRAAVGHVAPRPTGPGRDGAAAVRVPAFAGRTAARPGRRAPLRPVPVRRPAMARCVRSRAVAGTTRPVAHAGDRPAGWRGAVQLVVAGLVCAAAVFGLGTLADVMAQVRVPQATGPIMVGADETLFQLAHRAAPSADPTAVVHRIIELNDLASPSVQPGQVIVSPIG